MAKGEMVTRLTDSKVFGREQPAEVQARIADEPPTSHCSCQFFVKGSDESGKRVAFREKLIMKVVRDGDGGCYLAEGHVEEVGTLESYHGLGHGGVTQWPPTFVAVGP